MSGPIELLAQRNEPTEPKPASLPAKTASHLQESQSPKVTGSGLSPYFAGSVLLLGSLVGLTLLARPGSSIDPMNTIGLVGITALAVVRLTSAIWPVVRPAKATFYLFVLLWFGFAGFAAVSASAFPGGATYSAEQVRLVVLIVVIGCVFFEVGYASSKGIARSKLVERANRRTRTHFDRFAKLGLISSICSLLIWYRLGGLSLTLGDRVESARSFAEIGGESKAVAGVFVSLMRVPVGYFLVLGLVLLRRKQATSTLERATFVILVVVNLLVSSPLSTPRQWIGGLVVAAGLAMATQIRHQRAILLALVPAIVVIFPLANVFRSDVSRSTSVEFAAPTDVFTTRFDFDVFATTADATTTVDSIGLSHGRQALGAALFFVPRTYWPSKPTYSGALLFEQSRTNRSPHDNMSVTLWAEGYLDFGFVGVASYLGAYGAVAGLVDRRVRRPSESPPRLLATTYLLCGLSFIVLRGSLLSIAAMLASVAALQLGLSAIGSARKAPGGPRA